MEAETPAAKPTAPEKGVRCEVCGATLSDDEELQVHLDGHAEQAAEGNAPVEPPRHACPYCSVSFETPEALKGHIGSAHGK